MPRGSDEDDHFSTAPLVIASGRLVSYRDDPTRPPEGLERPFHPPMKTRG